MAITKRYSEKVMALPVKRVSYGDWGPGPWPEETPSKITEATRGSRDSHPSHRQSGRSDFKGMGHVPSDLNVSDLTASWTALISSCARSYFYGDQVG